MSRSGTTRSRIRSRRAAAGKRARLSLYARRTVFALGLGTLVVWLAAWVWLSGAGARSLSWSERKIHETAAENGFVVENLLVQGRHNTDPDVLRALINVERGDPILAFRPREVRELVERLSWVKSAHVERRLPNTIFIGLVERQPLALWQHKGKIRLVDAEGVTLADKNLEEFAHLPIIVGDDAPLRAKDLVRMLGAEPEIQSRLEAASWVGGRRWDLKLKNGVVVRLPEQDMGFALSRLVQAQEEDGLLDKDVSIIDAREPDRLTIRARPGTVQEYKAPAKGSDI